MTVMFYISKITNSLLGWVRKCIQIEGDLRLCTFLNCVWLYNLKFKIL